jgi:hypothetical protein
MDVIFDGGYLRNVWKVDDMQKGLQFVVDKTIFSLGKLNIDLKKSSHTYLDKAAIFLFRKRIQRIIERNIEDQIHNRMTLFAKYVVFHWHYSNISL